MQPCMARICLRINYDVVPMARERREMGNECSMMGRNKGRGVLTGMFSSTAEGNGSAVDDEDVVVFACSREFRQRQGSVGYVPT